MDSKIFLFINFLFCLKLTSVLSIENKGNNDIAQDFRNISMQSRQNILLSAQGSRNPYPKKYQIPNYINYGMYAKPHIYKPAHYYYPNQVYSNFQEAGSPNIRQSIMDVLYSVARNDDLQCIPRILCEITTGTFNGRQIGTNLPLNIDMQSLLGFLSSVNGLSISPLVYFGRAALLGYTSKGNKGSCTTAYPNCPSDPDKLVQYLNNYNGGFFRYFNGLNQQNYAPYQYNDAFYNINKNFRQSFYGSKGSAERRIQNKPVIYIPSNSIEQNSIFKFPDEEYNYRKSKTLLPTSDNFNNLFKQPGKPFIFPNYKQEYIKEDHNPLYSHNVKQFEKPEPHHKASLLIFPDRTGTGELIVDSSEFEKDHIAYEDNDITIKYNNQIAKNPNYRNMYGRFTFPDNLA
ncbi:uncharacterized protein [Diabrotica undecimpunctata]|uniref:uncharacterized protein n=1 Tax=Diabrotica undecimpunctata TaxID=50387 RepID=UPI003B63DF6A